MMTKKHYEGIAAALKRTDASRSTIAAVVEFCAANNPKFNAERFTDAARYTDAPTVKARELAYQVIAVWIEDGDLAAEVDDIAEDFDFGTVPEDRREMVKERAADLLRDLSNEEAA